MSNKPVNFYQGAKGTFRIDIVSHTVEGETVRKATHTYEEIKQAIEDGFLPYCVMKSNTGVDYFYLIYESDTLVFDGDIEQVTILDNDKVAVVEKESGDSGGGGEGGDTGTRDSYIVFLSQNDILVYQDGETDVPLLPSDIPSDNGLISITYVEPDSETPLYNYYSLVSIELDTTTLSAKKLIVYNYEHGDKLFRYSSDAGGFHQVKE